MTVSQFPESDRFMTLTWLCRYLCLMFSFMTIRAMSVTAKPEDESFRQTAAITVLVLAILTGIVSVILGRLFKKNADHPIFQSRAAIGLAMVLSILGTMMLGGR